MLKVMKKKSIMSFFSRDGGQKTGLIMRLTVLLMCVFSFTLVANTNAQQERVDLNLKDVSIRTVCGEIQKQTNLSFVYNVELTRNLGHFTRKRRRSRSRGWS